MKRGTTTTTTELAQEETEEDDALLSKKKKKKNNIFKRDPEAGMFVIFELFPLRHFTVILSH